MTWSDGGDAEPDVVVSETILVSGPRVVLSAVTTDGAETLWSARFFLTSGRVRGVAEEVARAIEFTLEARADETIDAGGGDAEVLDLCLRARFHYHQPTAADLARAVNLFAAALRRAPDHPRVLAG